MLTRLPVRAYQSKTNLRAIAYLRGIRSCEAAMVSGCCERVTFLRGRPIVYREEIVNSGPGQVVVAAGTVVFSVNDAV
jgi:hypothetical protein